MGIGSTAPACPTWDDGPNCGPQAAPPPLRAVNVPSRKHGKSLS